MLNQFYLDEIVAIEEIGVEETIDIEVSGNNLFVANDILTHNSGYSDSDADLTSTSESMGLPHTTDLFLALITNEELERNGHLLVKQLKNRFGDPSKNRRFIIGIDRPKMKWYNVSLESQNAANEPEAPEASPQPFRKKRDYSAIEA